MQCAEQKRPSGKDTGETHLSRALENLDIWATTGMRLELVLSGDSCPIIHSGKVIALTSPTEGKSNKKFEFVADS